MSIGNTQIMSLVSNVYIFKGVSLLLWLIQKTESQIVKSFSRGESPWRRTQIHWTDVVLTTISSLIPALFIAVLSSKLTDLKVPRPPVKDNFVKDSSVQ